jgi:predicted DCC family thiol-disulfide oxidoreductase YuxK
MLGRFAALWRQGVEVASHERLLIGTSLFRIGAGLTILYQCLINYRQRHYLYGPDGVYPWDTFVHRLGESGSFSLYALSPSPLLFELLFHLGLVVTFAWVLGWHTRLMTLFTYVVLWSLHERNPLLWDGGDNLLHLVLVYALFANLGAYFSLDAERLRAERLARPWHARALAMLHNAAMLAVALQVCLVYAVAGLYKVQGEMWQSGTALYYIMRVDEFSWPGYSELIYRNGLLVAALSYATVAFQVSFTFLFLLNRRTRLLALASGISFHLGIGIFMGLVTFSALLISVELALISDREYGAAGRAIEGVGSALGGWTARRRDALLASPAMTALRVNLFYDGWCPFCSGTVGLIRRLDVLGLIVARSFRESEVVERFRLDPARAEARLQAQAEPAGGVVEGVDALRLVASRIPALWPLVPVLWIASRVGLGRPAYDFIAARRLIVPSGCDQSCTLSAGTPARVRQLSA